MSVGFPTYGTPAINVKTGQWDRAWYLLLQSLYQRTGSSPGLDSDLVPEGSSHLYFTQTRSRQAISATGSISYDQTTGEINYAAPTTWPFSSITGKPATATGYGITSIDGVPVGATTPSTANFTTLTTTGAANLASVTTAGQVTAASAVLTTAAPIVASGQVGFGSTISSTVGATGAAAALPANPSGYLVINVNGTPVKIPYYSN